MKPPFSENPDCEDALRFDEAFGLRPAGLSSKGCARYLPASPPQSRLL